MPRIVDYTRRRAKLSDFERYVRSRRYRVSRSGAFVDPFPNIPGTLPEKMVFAKLMEKGFYFQFQSYFRANISEIGFSKDYRPDFLLPHEKIVIEVQGSYWHSQDKQIEEDSFKFAIFQTLGYKVLAWWDYEIFEKLDLLFLQEPRLAAKDRYGQRILTGKEATRDDSAGIRTMNRNRGYRQAYKKIIKSKGKGGKSRRKPINTRSLM